MAKRAAASLFATALAVLTLMIMASSVSVLAARDVHKLSPPTADVVDATKKSPNGGAEVADNKNFLSYGGIGGAAGIGAASGMVGPFGGLGGFSGIGGSAGIGSVGGVFPIGGAGVAGQPLP